MQRKTCYFSGRVQGVGFRYTAQNIAQQFDVRGFVKNLPDGRVQLVMEGPEEEMDYVVNSIRQRMNSFRCSPIRIPPPASSKNFASATECFAA